MAKNKFLALSLLIALLITAAVTLNVQAQNQGTLIVMDSVGGSTDPAAGTYNYNAGTNVALTATEQTGSIFQYWIVSTSSGSSTVTDNPLTLPMAAGTTYTVQAVFAPIQAPPGRILPSNLNTAAIVVVLAAAGGTTDPPAGTYAIDNASSLNLKATASSGWQFSHWVISGVMTSHGSSPVNLEPTDNPYNVNHGYGATYNYQPVFTQTSSSSPGPSPTVPEFSGVAVAFIAVMLVSVAVGTFVFKRRR
jgi:hypothetical protein